MRLPSAFSLSIAFLVSLLSLAVQAQGSDASQAGRTSLVEFTTSCDTAVASEINRAVELLHSFEYPESGKAFRSILESDPECAIARWGVAMNLWHPLWDSPNGAALEEGAGILASINRSAVTDREADYIDALTRFLHGLREVAPSRAGEGLSGGYAAGLHGQSG